MGQAMNIDEVLGAVLLWSFILFCSLETIWVKMILVVFVIASVWAFGTMIGAMIVFSVTITCVFFAGLRSMILN